MCNDVAGQHLQIYLPIIIKKNRDAVVAALGEVMRISGAMMQVISGMLHMIQQGLEAGQQKIWGVSLVSYAGFLPAVLSRQTVP